MRVCSSRRPVSAASRVLLAWRSVGCASFTAEPTHRSLQVVSQDKEKLSCKCAQATCRKRPHRVRVQQVWREVDDESRLYPAYRGDHQRVLGSIVRVQAGACGADAQRTKELRWPRAPAAATTSTADGETITQSIVD